MKLALREGMAPGDDLAAKLAWLERHGFDGIELHGPTADLPPAEVEAVFAG